MKALGAELGELRRHADGRQGLVGDLPAETQWAFDRDAEVTKRLVREDLDSVVLLEVAVKVGDLGDLLRADQLALFAEALAHLDPQFAGVDELNLAAACGALAIREDPEVGRDAGVVKELVRQSDDRLQPVVLDDPAPDLRLPRPCSTGFILEIMCCRNRKLPSLMRGRPAPNRPANPLAACSSRTSFSTFFQSTPNGGLASR